MKLYSHYFAAFACRNEVQVFTSSQSSAEVVFSAIEAEALRIQQKFSRYDPNSVVSKINRDGASCAVSIDQETAKLLSYADTAHKVSGGLFDVTTGALRRAWDFSSAKLPDPQALNQVLSGVGWQHVDVHQSTISLKLKGTQIDLGGIGKEYAVDRAVAVAEERGFFNLLVNFGGDVRVAGPQGDGSPWRVGIKHPRKADGLVGHVELQVGAMATSGDYERFIEIDGQRYCHILNPQTGYPVQDLQSVTVLAPSCLLAGTYTTTAMLLPEIEAMKLIQEAGFFAVMVTKQGEVKKLPPH